MAGMTDLHLGPQGRLYEAGKTIKAFCEQGCCLSPPTTRCRGMGCGLYGLGDKLMEESGCASAVGLIRQGE